MKGPSFTVSDKIHPSGYNKISAQLPSELDKVTTINVTGDGQVMLLFIKTADDKYGIPGKRITYSADGTEWLELERAHFLIGESLVQLLGSNPPKQIQFKNRTESNQEVQLLIGREDVEVE